MGYKQLETHLTTGQSTNNISSFWQVLLHQYCQSSSWNLQ